MPKMLVDKRGFTREFTAPTQIDNRSVTESCNVYSLIGDLCLWCGEIHETPKAVDAPATMTETEKATQLELFQEASHG